MLKIGFTLKVSLCSALWTSAPLDLVASMALCWSRVPATIYLSGQHYSDCLLPPGTHYFCLLQKGGLSSDLLCTMSHICQLSRPYVKYFSIFILLSIIFIMYYCHYYRCTPTLPPSCTSIQPPEF